MHLSKFKNFVALLALLAIFFQAAHLARAAVVVTSVTVSSTTVDNWRYGGTTAKVRVYASDTFDQSGNFVIGSRRGSGQWYKQIDCTVAGTVLSIPSFSLYVTTTSTNANANYTFVFVDSKGAERDVYLGEIKVPDTFGANVTWSQLYSFNVQRTTRRADYEVYNKDQVNALLLAGVIPASPAKASTTVHGISKISITPVDANDPITVGKNDSASTSNAGVVTMTGSSSVAVSTNDTRVASVRVPVCAGTDDTAAFSTLISQFLSNVGTIRLPYINGTRCAVNTLTIPSNVTLDNSDGTGIKVNTGQTLTIQGPIVAPAKPVFFNSFLGQGEVSLSGNAGLTHINPAWWGVVGVAHGGTPSDESAGFLAVLAAAYTAKGGIIQFGERAYRFDSQLSIPNDGAPTPSQPSLRITGAGASHNGQGGAPNGGTIIDLRYNGTVAKIDTRGLGLLEIDHITFKDGSASVLPFVQTTNTTLLIHDSEFYGSTAQPTTQDAIVLGGTSTVIGGGSNAPFQGYGTVIRENYFNRIQRGVYGRTFANNIIIQNNNWWTQCGATSSAAAVEFTGVGTNAGNVIVGNLIEMDGYVYGMKFNDGFVINNVGPNGFFDGAGGVTAYYRFETGATFNLVVDGFRNDAAGVLVSEVGTAIGTNTVLTAHQLQRSKLAQPWDFLNEVKSIRQSSPTWIIQDNAGNQASQVYIDTTFDLWRFQFTPLGGSLRNGMALVDVGATRADLLLLGTSDNRVTANAGDLRVQAFTGGTLWLGTAVVQDVQLLSAAGTSTALPITSTLATGTAPFNITSTTNVANLNASFLNGSTFAAPGAIGGGTPAAGTFTTLTANTSLTINGGTAVTKFLSATASLDFTALAANSCEVLTVTVTGAADGDIVDLGVPNALSDVDGATERTTFFGWVSAANTVSVRRCNVTGTVTADPTAATVRAGVTKF